MTDTVWKTTAATSSAVSGAAPGGPARLLQIHPVEINRGLVTLSDKDFRIGRNKDCDLQIDDEAVSRHHLRIEYRRGEYFVIDLGSTNGTFVNGEQVGERKLVPGDRLGVGKHIFKLLSCDHIEAQYYEAVYNMMTQDALTNVVNRRAFLDILKRETRRSLNTSRPLSLILVDIDHFKPINDVHGHLAGDQVLRELAVRIGQVIESHVEFARYGGEEFVLLIPEMNCREASVVAERIRCTIAAEPFTIVEGLIPLTISLGVADLTDLSPDSLCPDQDLIARADAKLYEAKRNGRDCVCY